MRPVTAGATHLERTRRRAPARWRRAAACALNTTIAGRIGATSLRYLSVAPLASHLDRPGCADAVRAVAGGAVGRAHFRALGDEHAMLAAPVLGQQRRGIGRVRDGLIVAATAEFRNLIGCGDAVRLCRPARLPMLDTRAVTGVAGESRLRVWMLKKIGDSFRVAGSADFMNRLLRAGDASHRNRGHQQGGKGKDPSGVRWKGPPKGGDCLTVEPCQSGLETAAHCGGFLIKLRSIEATFGLPARAIESANSARSSSTTRCTPTCPKAAMPQT